MRKMTITEGLVELKLLDARIGKATDKEWAIACKKSDITPDNLKKFTTDVKSYYQAVTDLIKERNKIKSAIVKSNAKTTVKVGEKKMTVAEAIERKTSIQYEKSLLRAWKHSLSESERVFAQTNARVQGKIDSMLSQLVASEQQDIEEASRVITESYMLKNGLEIIDPLNLKEKIEKLDKEIDEFESNIDTALSLSNAVTMIEV